MAPVVLFDGECNFCNATVQKILKYEKAPTLKFTALQSEAGQQILRQAGEDTQTFNSFILYEDGKMYKRSTAALTVTKYLRAPMRWLGALRIIPRFIRDAVYDFIAARRYKWFGKRDQCMIPTPEQRARFL